MLWLLLAVILMNVGIEEDLTINHSTRDSNNKILMESKETIGDDRDIMMNLEDCEKSKNETRINVDDCKT